MCVTLQCAVLSASAVCSTPIQHGQILCSMLADILASPGGLERSHPPQQPAAAPLPQPDAICQLRSEHSYLGSTPTLGANKLKQR